MQNTVKINYANDEITHLFG